MFDLDAVLYLATSCCRGAGQLFLLLLLLLWFTVAHLLGAERNGCRVWLEHCPRGNYRGADVTQVLGPGDPGDHAHPPTCAGVDSKLRGTDHSGRVRSGEGFMGEALTDWCNVAVSEICVSGDGGYCGPTYGSAGAVSAMTLAVLTALSSLHHTMQENTLRVVLILLHGMVQYWDAPFEFRPERHTKEGKEAQIQGQFVPFGGEFFCWVKHSTLSVVAVVVHSCASSRWQTHMHRQSVWCA